MYVVMIRLNVVLAQEQFQVDLAEPREETGIPRPQHPRHVPQENETNDWNEGDIRVYFAAFWLVVTQHGDGPIHTQTDDGRQGSAQCHSLREQIRVIVVVENVELLPDDQQHSEAHAVQYGVAIEFPPKPPVFDVVVGGYEQSLPGPGNKDLLKEDLGHEQNSYDAEQADKLHQQVKVLHVVIFGCLSCYSRRKSQKTVYHQVPEGQQRPEIVELVRSVHA
ncbi:hypothetical protein GWI33_018567 [Rhynchophorus ferrugineus]|uniref:Uncharacterized protein n=1 Tax=Rhynchophorus ferrugineus TaxID=354439 RepID=A0A834HUN4_RHYFE|nr:hypothetical protein GWI33_018567 [Rhynchophorus ferrugineus]